VAAEQGRLDVNLAAQASWATLAISGDLDIATAPVLVATAERAVEDRPSGELVVDLSGVGFCDSAGINALVRVRKISDQSGWVMRVTNPQMAVRRVLELTGVHTHLNLT
jgi:anti-sigma B factor antagonist